MIINDYRQIILTASDRGKAEADLLKSELEREGYKVQKTISTTKIYLDASKGGKA